MTITPKRGKDSLAFKSLLRYDYGIQVFSITEPSEETDGEIGMFVEGLMEQRTELIADFVEKIFVQNRKVVIKFDFSIDEI